MRFQSRIAQPKRQRKQSLCNFANLVWYTATMKALLSDEQRQALDGHPDGIEIEDPQTQRMYFLTDVDFHRRAADALRQQEDSDAIQCGIDDMEAGRVVPFEEVDRRIRATLGLSPRTT
jgi:hypothetical protein